MTNRFYIHKRVVKGQMNCYCIFIYICNHTKIQKRVVSTKLEYFILIIYSNICIVGHDTTTSGIAWILYELAKHQHYQKACQDEIDQVMIDNKDFVTW